MSACVKHNTFVPTGYKHLRLTSHVERRCTIRCLGFSYQIGIQINHHFFQVIKTYFRVVSIGQLVDNSFPKTAFSNIGQCQHLLGATGCLKRHIVKAVPVFHLATDNFKRRTSIIVGRNALKRTVIAENENYQIAHVRQIASARFRFHRHIRYRGTGKCQVHSYGHPFHYVVCFHQFVINTTNQHQGSGNQGSKPSIYRMQYLFHKHPPVFEFFIQN